MSVTTEKVGGGVMQQKKRMSLMQLTFIVAVNMMGTFWSCSVAGRAMMAQGRGSIVNISSTAGDSPVPKLSVYGMTKAAVNQLTRASARGRGVRKWDVTSVSATPGRAERPRSMAGNALCTLQLTRFVIRGTSRAFL